MVTRSELMAGSILAAEAFGHPALDQRAWYLPELRWKDQLSSEAP